MTRPRWVLDIGSGRYQPQVFEQVAGVRKVVRAVEIDPYLNMARAAADESVQRGLSTVGGVLGEAIGTRRTSKSPHCVRS